MARPKSENPRKGVNTRHLQSVIDECAFIGAETGRSMRAVIADAVEEYVKRERKRLDKLAAKETAAA